MKRILTAVVLILVLGVAGAAWWLLRGGTFTVTVTQAELEERLGKHFPLRKEYLVVLQVHYENPRVRLTDGSDEIGLGVDVRVNVPLVTREAKGAADLMAKIAYDAERATFVLHDARLVDLRVAGIPDEHAARVKDVANLLTREQVSGIPVYTLRPSDTKKALARAALKSATVRDGVLVLELGL